MKDTNDTACSNKSQLIDRIKEAFEALAKDTVRVACTRFPIRMKAMVDAEGGFFEEIVFWLL